MDMSNTPDTRKPIHLFTKRMQSSQESPLVVSQSLTQLLERDVIQVELIPEKKGLFLKHVEYQIRSQLIIGDIVKMSRYSDFVVFRELLLQRFPYRMVPALPPKQILNGVLALTPEQEFIEGRRRALSRFTALVARHPSFSADELVKTFLTFPDSGVQNKLREVFKNLGNEFKTSKFVAQAKETLPSDVKIQLASSKELITSVLHTFHRLRGRLQRKVERTKENATDLLLFGRELGAVGSYVSPVPPLALTSGWGTLQESLHELSVHCALLADKVAKQGRREEDDVMEKLNFFLDLLQTYKELCERRERLVLHQDQLALQKHGVAQRQASSGKQEAKEQLEQRVAQREEAILSTEILCNFSLFCLHQETQLIFTYLQIAAPILGAFINSQIKAHKEVSKMWDDLRSEVKCLSESPSSIPVTCSPLDDNHCLGFN